MRSPALALTWQVWWRYRWGLLACAAACLVLGALGSLLPPGSWAPALPAGEPLLQVIVVVIGACAATLLFVVYTFSGLAEAQLEATEAGFAPRQFLLPVSTPALVFWPMAQGAVASAAAWLVCAGAVLGPAGVKADLVWPALLTAALLAWLQAVVWWPFPMRFIRTPVAALALTVVVTVPLIGLLLGEAPTATAVVLAALVPAAYGVAVVGVARTRRGDVPVWTWPGRLGRALVAPRPRRGGAFSSPLQAQSWFEWRTRGMAFLFPIGLIGFVWILLALSGAGEEAIDALAAAGDAPVVAAGARALTAPGLLVAELLVVLPIMAGVSGIDLGGTSLAGPKLGGTAGGCHPFFALRPLTDGELVVAKLRMAVRAALTAGALVILAAVLYLGPTGKWRDLAAAPLLQPYSTLEVGAGLAAGLALLVFLTWLNLVGGLPLRLTGRNWLIKTVSYATVPAWVLFGLVCHRLVREPEFLARARQTVPFVAAGAVALKLLLAAWLAKTLWRRGLVAPRGLATAAAAWALMAAGFVFLLSWWVPSEWMSLPTLVLGVVLALPLNRFAAAPLALEWNRHR